MLKEIFLYFPSPAVADKCIQCLPYNKLLLSVVRFVSEWPSYGYYLSNIKRTINFCFYYLTPHEKLKQRYYETIQYLLNVNKEHFIKGTTHLLPYNVNDKYGNENDEDVNIFGYYSSPGKNIFHYAHKDPILLKILLDYCGDNKGIVCCKDSNNDTPFYLACCADEYKINIDCIKLFLQYDANINDIDNNGTSAFHKMSLGTRLMLVASK